MYPTQGPGLLECTSSSPRLLLAPPTQVPCSGGSIPELPGGAKPRPWPPSSLERAYQDRALLALAVLTHRSSPVGPQGPRKGKASGGSLKGKAQGVAAPSGGCRVRAAPGPLKERWRRGPAETGQAEKKGKRQNFGWKTGVEEMRASEQTGPWAGRSQGWGLGTLQEGLAALGPRPPPLPQSRWAGGLVATSRERHSAPGAQANANRPLRELRRGGRGEGRRRAIYSGSAQARPVRREARIAPQGPSPGRAPVRRCSTPHAARVGPGAWGPRRSPSAPPSAAHSQRPPSPCAPGSPDRRGSALRFLGAPTYLPTDARPEGRDGGAWGGRGSAAPGGAAGRAGALGRSRGRRCAHRT